MLKPSSDRLDYGKLLAPPDGYTLDAAVGTSYSLDFDALVGVCMALGLSADTDSALLNNPVYLLETLRRTGDRVALFCQAGQIQVPSNASVLYILLEKIVYQVQVKKQRTPPQFPSFHPKFWLLKYIRADGDELYRVVVLSRNLTFDRSWDVSVVLDGRRQAKSLPKNKPLVDFAEYLRNSIAASDDNAKAKRKLLRGLISELEYVDFQTESREFTDFEFIPVSVPKAGGGIYKMNDTPLFASTFHEMLIMSPFLSGSVIEEFNNRNRNIENPNCLLITRRESLVRLKPNQCENFNIYTMKDIVVEGETALSDDEKATRKQDIHAKLYMWRRYSDSELYLGSLNASYSALEGNVEFVLRLVSRNRWLNMDKLTKDLFCGAPDGPDNPFELTELPDAIEPDEDVLTVLERQIKELCRLSPKASVEFHDDKYSVSIYFDKLQDIENISISPLLSNKSAPLAPVVTIGGLLLLQLSEFYCITAQCDGKNVRRVIKIPTENIPQNRENAVVTDVVKDTKCFFQYLAFLLGDDYLVSALENAEIQNGGLFGVNNQAAMPALYERMLRTAAISPEKFGEIDYILKMVDADGIIPDGFAELYHSFRKAVGLRD